ncbi:hypothetical protein RRG08_003302 [Elysia crispata]|uniref:Uncharacterized protein n=1 Tax=Elysia crispata TaxID=231223 RepID=A0AAE0ZRT0_9GAST|nr:hypothetical protein RRG08_003302 [Elysia crispata]
MVDPRGILKRKKRPSGTTIRGGIGGDGVQRTPAKADHIAPFDSRGGNVAPRWSRFRGNPKSICEGLTLAETSTNLKRLTTPDWGNHCEGPPGRGKSEVGHFASKIHFNMSN